MKTRDEIIADNPIERVLDARGVVLRKSGTGHIAICPFHEDKNPSLSVNIAQGLWKCHAGCGSGSVLDLLAKFEGVPVVDVLKQLGNNGEAYHPAVQSGPTVDCVYSYHNALGEEVYQVARMKPKSFRQRHSDGKGGWVWNMDGIERVLYRLPEVNKSTHVWICEGEKDVETLRSIGMCATTNAGGAGKWMDAYTESLKGKEIILCGDNDEPGVKHMRKVRESIDHVAKSVRLVTIPKPFKDVSDFAASFGDKEKFAEALEPLFNAAPITMGGSLLPIRSMAEMEIEYITHVKRARSTVIRLSDWIPSLSCVRPLVEGELVSIIGDTGTAKTYVLQHIAYHCRVPTLLFELELPDALTFERFLSVAKRMSGDSVFATYNQDSRLEFADLRHIYTCGKSKLAPDEIEALILKSELKIGVRPALVLVDYVQLVHGTGQSRYEKVSSVAEQLKIIAKSTSTVIVLASQVGRGQDSVEVNLHSAKDSGSIENSSGVVIGIWRDENDAHILNLRVLKNTKGRPSAVIQCQLAANGSMRIVERSKIADEDVPQNLRHT